MPTAFYDSNFRFYFFSKEETRKHVHVASTTGEVKIWLEPKIQVAKNIHINQEDVNKILDIVEARKEELVNAWNTHFGKN